jgi:hypothetical protein
MQMISPTPSRLLRDNHDEKPIQIAALQWAVIEPYMPVREGLNKELAAGCPPLKLQ